MKRIAAFAISILFSFAVQNAFADIEYMDPPYASNDSDNGYSYSNNDSYDYSNAFPEPEERQVYHYESHHHHKTQHVAHVSMPATINPQGEPVIIVNPRIHGWGAYTADGKLLKSGLATAGSSWCNDLDRPCRTKVGTFRINSLGSADCYSKRFPLGEGGAPMPYCMYFNGGQGIHGSHELAYANLSHGCVRVSVSDAKWLRYNFTHINTKVVIEPY